MPFFWSLPTSRSARVFSVMRIHRLEQDLPNAMNAAEITDKLGLHSLRQRAWYIQAACATSGDGLYEGLEWVSGLSHVLQSMSDASSSRPTSRSVVGRGGDQEFSLAKPHCIRSDSLHPPPDSLTNLTTLCLITAASPQRLDNLIFSSRQTLCRKYTMHARSCLDAGMLPRAPTGER